MIRLKPYSVRLILPSNENGLSNILLPVKRINQKYQPCHYINRHPQCFFIEIYRNNWIKKNGYNSKGNYPKIDSLFFVLFHNDKNRNKRYDYSQKSIIAYR